MAVELHIFMQESRVPGRDVWQQAIERLGFPTVLDPSFELRADTGFSPTTYNGESTGFEFYLEPAADTLVSDSHIRSQVERRDMCATFRWGCDLTECAAALSAAGALASVTDGIYFDPDADILHGAEEAVEAVRRDLKSL